MGDKRIKVKKEMTPKPIDIKSLIHKVSKPFDDNDEQQWCETSSMVETAKHGEIIGEQTIKKDWRGT